MSVEAMRAAVIAIRAGVFDDLPPGGDPADAAARSGSSGLWSALQSGSRVVVVVAGHPGAGASMVALAVAEALCGRSGSARVQLVDYAEPHRSGLVAAAGSELGVDGAGWRRGRRGALDLARRGEPGRPGEELPQPPAPGGRAGDRWLVLDPGWVDPGWAATFELSRTGLASAGLPGARLIVVTRASVPGVRQTEGVLDLLGEPAVLAAVGPRRWPPVVTASCGPRLRAAVVAGRLVRVPLDRRLAVRGLTADRLPPRVAAAGRALAAQLVSDRSTPDRSASPALILPADWAALRGSAR